MTKRILIIRFSSIGDIVLTTPVVRALKQQAGAEIHFLTKAAFVPVIRFNPYISKIITLSDDFEAMMEELKGYQYDYIVDLHHNIRTQRIRFYLQRPGRAFHKLNFQKWLFVRFGLNRLPDKHIVDRYMETASRFGVKSDGAGLDFFIPPDKEVDLRSVFGLSPGSFVAIVTGAAHQTKCMTVEQIIRLCHLLQKPVILLGGKDEMEKGEHILRGIASHDVKNACGQLDILQSASIVRQAGVVITPDTGLMHIAAALRKPQIVVWGNTVPQFGMYPYYGSENIVWISFEQTQLNCRPCSKLGFQQCPKGHFRCMLDHDLEKMAGAANEIFN